MRDSFHAGERMEKLMADQVLQSGSHIARIATQPQADGTFEAQVFVRLAREPEIAETYIPAGVCPTEEEALELAKERATRALKENEF
jgi:hypothetical protein